MDFTTYGPEVGQYQIVVQYQYQYFLKFHFQYQDQYQYCTWKTIKININIKTNIFSKRNINIKINILKNLNSISIPASISSIYWYWYWKSIFHWAMLTALEPGSCSLSSRQAGLSSRQAEHHFFQIAISPSIFVLHTCTRCQIDGNCLRISGVFENLS